VLTRGPEKSAEEGENGKDEKEEKRRRAVAQGCRADPIHLLAQ